MPAGIRRFLKFIFLEKHESTLICDWQMHTLSQMFTKLELLLIVVLKETHVLLVFVMQSSILIALTTKALKKVKFLSIGLNNDAKNILKH